MAGVINIITKKATIEWTGLVSFTANQTDGVNGGGLGKGVSFLLQGSLQIILTLIDAAESTSTDAILDNGALLVCHRKRP